MESMNTRYDAKGFLARLITAGITGQPREDFVDQEMRRLQCSFCRDGWSLNAEGQHVLLGVVVPCDASLPGG